MQNNFTIQTDNGRYGVVDSADNAVIIPFEYDNIFMLCPGMNVLILHRAGKVGAVRINCDTYEQIVPCEYNYFQGCRNLIFYSAEKVCCYFYNSKLSMVFSELCVIDDIQRYLFAADELSYYILRGNTGEVLWKDKKSSSHYTIGAPCPLYMGEADGLPLIYDCTYSAYFLPDCAGGLKYCNNMEIIFPVIVSGENIVNIVDKDGVGVLDVRSETYDEVCGDHDEVTVELRVTLKKGAFTEERSYPLPHGRFVPGDMSDPGKWLYGMRD